MSMPSTEDALRYVLANVDDARAALERASSALATATAYGRIVIAQTTRRAMMGPEQQARDGLADAYAYLRAVLERDPDAVTTVRQHADPLALADALLFIIMTRSADVDELRDWVNRQTESLRIQEMLERLDKDTGVE
jgi:hypothetical protein